MSITPIVAVVLLALSAPTTPTESQEPKSSVRELVSVSGTVERIDRSTRTLTLRTSSNTTEVTTVAPEVKLFNELKSGDRVTVRHSQSVVVAVRPGTKPSPPVDTTDRAISRDPSGRSEVLQQLTAAVTIERVDRSKSLVVYKTSDNQRAMRTVVDPGLLEGLKAGDVIEITYTREVAVDLQRSR